MKKMHPHEHIFKTGRHGSRWCEVCGFKSRVPPLPVLHLRCEWCKSLFDWHTRVSVIEHVSVKRCCSIKCTNSLRSWEQEKKKFRTEVAAID